jgi:very-short-patch-repair endonuclease
MPPRQQIPDHLKRGPVTVADAERSGFSRQRLRGPNWRRLGRGTYVWTGLKEVENGELVALGRRLPPGCVFSGRTAARLLGVDIDAGSSIEITTPPGASVRARSGLTVTAAALHPSEVTTRASLPVTAPLRTCFDLARRLPLVEGVAVLDSALYRKLVSPHGLRDYVSGVSGRKGVPQARRAVEFVELDVESPMETRLRMLLVLGGLPRPRVQVELRDAAGRFLARPDLLYPQARLAIEYDGSNHRSRLVADNRRQNRLQRAGYRLLRYTGPDVFDRPDAILAEVRAELRIPARASPSG